MSFTSRDRLRTALQVLSRFSAYRRPTENETRELILLAETDEERTMPLDDLACVVIKRECERIAGTMKSLAAG